MDTRTTETQTMTLEQAAKYVGISRSLAYDLARAGKFPGCNRLGKRFVVSKRVIAKWLEGAGDQQGDVKVLAAS